MGSKTRTYLKTKLLGQVYTPSFIVEKILKDTGFFELNFFKNRMLDPACGDGRFLAPMVAYIIDNTPVNQLKTCLENIYGWDIDQDAINSCCANLDRLVAPLGLTIEWKLYRLDALQQISKDLKFDLIVGNPPYIRIQNLSPVQRDFIQKNYSFCKSGSTDAFVAFFQLAASLLTPNGICGMITPNSFLTSQAAKPLRSYFTQEQNLKQITNYGSVRVFGNTGTYTAVTIFGPQKNRVFQYEMAGHDLVYKKRKIPFSAFQEHEPWHLTTEEAEALTGVKLGDLCQISVGLTTLADGIFLMSILEEKDDLVKCQSKDGAIVWLEKKILKPIIKGSKLKRSDDPITEYILFPYKEDLSGKNKVIPEEKLAENFPYAFAYLNTVKDQLLKRDNGKPNAVAWYAYGRAQGLDSSFGRKIIFSPMNRYPNFILCENTDCTVYSGYFIKYNGDHAHLLSQLNSQRMADFIAVAGRDFQGGYKGYNKKVVENFIITDVK